MYQGYFQPPPLSVPAALVCWLEGASNVRAAGAVAGAEGAAGAPRRRSDALTLPAAS